VLGPATSRVEPSLPAALKGDAMLGRLLTLARWAVGLLLALLLVSLVGLAATVQVAIHEGYSAYQIHGGSMEPALSLGALVFVKPTDSAFVNRGDVITVRTVDGPD
jgi:signal peptidase I